MDTAYKFIRTKYKGNLWSLPGALMKKYLLNENDHIILQCGSASTPALVSRMRSSTYAGEMGFSSAILNSLYIPENTALQIKPTGNNIFRLGPVIGILTFRSYITGRLGYYKTHSNRMKDSGLLYVFRGQDINPSKRTVNGYCYDYAANKWKKHEFPYPDAVIDRCYPNPYIYHSLLEQVIGPGKIFNKQSMINKLDFFEALDTDNFLRKYIPQTRSFNHSLDLTYFLQKYPEVFLKPVNAMKGNGIVVVRNIGQGLLECQYRIKGKNFNQQINSTAEIYPVLESAAGLSRPYVIQQGVSRMIYQEGPFSFRTWAMKNGKGRWVMPGMFAKGTFGKSFLTNFTAGAKLIPLKGLFDEIIPRLPYSKRKLVRSMKNLTLKTAAVLDKHYGPLGELGLDIVLDIKGSPWLIEANGNPGNIPIFIQTEYPSWRNLVFQYPLDYASFLAGFS